MLVTHHYARPVAPGSFPRIALPARVTRKIERYDASLLYLIFPFSFIMPFTFTVEV
jgi:hypothetical protein